MPAWKRDPETSWLAQADSMALQQSIRDLDRAYKNFFRRVREGGKPGFPKFKSRRHARQSYRTNGGKVIDRNQQARRPAAVGTVVGLPRVRYAPRPRCQRRSEHSHGGEAHPLQHGRYRGARGNRGGCSRLNARGEDVRPEGTATVPDGRPRRTENPLVSTTGIVKGISSFETRGCRRHGGEGT